MNRPTYFSVQEVAKELGVTPETVYHYIDTGKLGAIKDWHRYRYRITRTSIERFKWNERRNKK